ncbi:MAG: hypothetical protein ACK4SY_07645 [Pyrobaculum sp.]
MLSRGFAYGALSGVIVGSLLALLTYMYMVTYEEQFKAELYRKYVGVEVIDVIDLIGVLTKVMTVVTPILSFLVALAFNMTLSMLIVYFWKFVKPWHRLGLLVGVLFSIVFIIGIWIELPMTKITVLEYIWVLLLTFASPLLIAWFLNREATRSC